MMKTYGDLYVLRIKERHYPVVSLGGEYRYLEGLSFLGLIDAHGRCYGERYDDAVTLLDDYKKRVLGGQHRDNLLTTIPATHKEIGRRLSCYDAEESMTLEERPVRGEGTTLKKIGLILLWVVIGLGGDRRSHSASEDVNRTLYRWWNELS